MNILMKYLFLFFVGAIGGWVIELLFRRFFSPPKKWINPGFLNGPYLPLYGFGACILYAVSDISGLDLIWKFVIIAVSMTVVELIAGAIFILGMGIKLWDYSKRWLNFKGIICPLFSLLWALVGAIFLFFIYPSLQGALSWLNDNPFFSFVVGLFYGVFAVDIGISFNLSAKIRKIVKETKSVVEFELLKADIRQNAIENKERHSFLFAFHTARSLKEEIEQYLEKRKQKKTNEKNKSEEA